MFAQTMKKVCRKGLRYRECLEDMDLSSSERERLRAKKYAPHPKTVKVPPLSSFPLGAKGPSTRVSLADISIVTSSSSRDVSEEHEVERFPRLFHLPVFLRYEQHD